MKKVIKDQENSNKKIKGADTEGKLISQEDLEKVSGGAGSEFASIPRVPVRKIDEELKKKI